MLIIAGLMCFFDQAHAGDFLNLRSSSTQGDPRSWVLLGSDFPKWKKTMMPSVYEADQPAAQVESGKPDFRYSVGVPFLSVTMFEWSKYSRNNEMIGFRGINYGLGFQSKNYFKPLRKHAWNSFWQWGTMLVILPYIGIGTEFTTDNIYFEVATVYIFPYLALGVHF
ncbi:MAG: hypothetical protein A3G34_01605 [Candidatus Lindowbacteria bacterium RIFCSPLOWO2_12_FULL_62_27]|nr:MAG: hypothetical protein A3I06_05885 [Candidatus Lindowbacteria bacterium RIFCSPLOWO2_02_FULL_62_12]OGH59007.1 MAG: hypothetical protein A3G34_01605 [Candidatus Lindowbacteria bacterium RIFCSPLOWO2_12_FULL_62_27]